MTDYPEGARWRATNSVGKIAVVWLDKRHSNWEAWRWSTCHSDGSGATSDWTTSYRMATEECRVSLAIVSEKVRFKRVNPEDDLEENRVPYS